MREHPDKTPFELAEMALNAFSAARRDFSWVEETLTRRMPNTSSFYQGMKSRQTSIWFFSLGEFAGKVKELGPRVTEGLRQFHEGWMLLKELREAVREVTP